MKLSAGTLMASLVLPTIQANSLPYRALQSASREAAASVALRSVTRTSPPPFLAEMEELTTATGIVRHVRLLWSCWTSPSRISLAS